MAEIKKSDNNLLAAVAYLGWWVTGLVLLLTQKKNDYVRFHAMQSMIVFGAITLVYIALGIVPVLGWLLALLIGPILGIGSFVLWLLLMYKAYIGEKYKLPYFGALAEKQLEKMK